MTYIKKRSYPVSYVEMGEEPHGQYMLPEDYAALYLQFATALHRVDPNFKVGGPVFEGVTEDIKAWPDAQGRTSWLGRFLAYLRSPTDTGFGLYVVRTLSLRRLRDPVGEPLSGTGADYPHHESLARRRIASRHPATRH